ncbi:MAG: uncharacterized protein A8A55_2767 [Amphiamblys sp. WSBS2006]|nr:MAG: uncharacterized protein A8A55_2767 [Amphiamblys sp. WSBS2006]
MKIFSVSLATLAACVCALDSRFAYVPRDVLLRFPTEQDGDIYIMGESKQADKLCSVYFVSDARDKSVPSPVSLLRFVYDETEARTRYPNARDIAEEVSIFIAKHAEVDTERKLFFVSFANDVSPVQEVPEDIAEVFVLRIKENNIDYLYKKEKEHGSHFDNFLIIKECKREDKERNPRIKNIPRKRKEAALLLSFLAAKEFQLDLEAAPSMHWEEGNKWGLKLPYGVSLFVSEENNFYLELFDLTETKIKRLTASSFDVTKANLKNTHIEELFLVDEAALNFFYDSTENSEFYVENVSFGNKLNTKREKVLKLIERVHWGETTAPKKIKTLVLNRNSFFWFIEEARRISQRKIYVEDLAVTLYGKNKGPEIETKIVVSKRIRIIGNARVLLFIEFGPELSHLGIDEIQRQCLSPEIEISRINMQLTKNRVIVKENLHVLQFLKKNITATEVCFFANKGKKELESTEITLVSGEMESIVFGGKGLSVLSCIANEKIDVRNMTVMDIVGFSTEEKTKKKKFVIRERLYMRNTGIFFLELLGETVFIPVVEIEVDRWKEHWGRFEETAGINIKTNALVENISPEIESAGEIKQKIGEMAIQKKTVMKNEFGYQRLVFEEDSKHGEQNETGESEEKPITECQILEEFKEYCKYEEQRESEESNEQPTTGFQMFGGFKEGYSLLEGSLDMQIPEDLFSPEESDCLQDEEVIDIFVKLFLEGRG